MPKPQSNQHYFKISQNNPEPHLDKNYFFLDKHPELPLYVVNVKEIKEILITIKKLKEERENTRTLEKYYQKLFSFFNDQYSNCSELGCFVNACDTTRDLIQKDYLAFKTVTDLFIQKRDLDDKVPENWLQAIIDSNSSRKKGKSGEDKLIRMLENYGFIKIDDWQEFEQNQYCVAKFSKDIFSIAAIRKKFNINIDTKKQDKMLDLLIKCRDKIFLLEAKHSNISGGEQDKQISELIEIMSLKETAKNIYYISFLDGTYSNVLLGTVSQRAHKRLKQLDDIQKYLLRNPQNFWVNTAGFTALINDLKR